MTVPVCNQWCNALRVLHPTNLAYLRWPNPVRPGDSLTLALLVLEQRVSDSKPWLGIVRWQWLMTKQDGAVVLDLEATSLFRLG